MNLKIIPSIFVIIVLLTSFLFPIISDFGEDSKVADVVIIAGQSNAGYRESVSYRVDPNIATRELPLSDSLYYYGTLTSPATYETISNPTYDPTFESYSLHKMCRDNRYIIGGLEAPLAIGIHNITGHDVIVLNVAVSSATISWLDPDGVWGTFASGVISNAMDKINTKYHTVNKIGWVCLQGESDADTSIDTYKTNFIRLMDYMDSFGFNNGYIVPPRESIGGNAYVAQYDLASEYDNLHISTNIQNTFTVENGLLYGDDIHYTELGRIEIGKAVVDSMDLPKNNSMSIKPLLYAVVPLIIVSVIMGCLITFRTKY